MPDADYRGKLFEGGRHWTGIAIQIDCVTDQQALLVSEVEHDGFSEFDNAKALFREGILDPDGPRLNDLALDEFQAFHVEELPR